VAASGCAATPSTSSRRSTPSSRAGGALRRRGRFAAALRPADRPRAPEDPRFTLYPRRTTSRRARTCCARLDGIKDELKERIDFFVKGGKLVEAQRIEQRTRFDIEMLNELGFCKGIENYTRHISGAAPGEPPPTLVDYLPPTR